MDFDYFVRSALAVSASGFHAPDVALLLNRTLIGFFFVFSGYHKLFNADRHASVRATLVADGVPFVKFNEWFVPSVEFLAGSAVVFGIFAPLAAVFLIAICLVATCVDGMKRVKAYKPIDAADFCDDVLYLPEVLYMISLVVVVLAGPGAMALLD